MVKQPYSCYLKVLGGVGWDKKEFLETNLHVYGRNDTKIIVYRRGGPKETQGEIKKSL